MSLFWSHPSPSKPRSRGAATGVPVFRRTGTPGWQRSLYRGALIPAAIAAYFPVAHDLPDPARFGVATVLMCWLAWAADPCCVEAER